MQSDREPRRCTEERESERETRSRLWPGRIIGRGLSSAHFFPPSAARAQNRVEGGGTAEVPGSRLAQHFGQPRIAGLRAGRGLPPSQIACAQQIVIDAV
jgi:hypothetical protein